MSTTELQITGPPGTGKTTYLQRQVEHDVAREGPEAVLITSLTRTAAAEVKGRRLPIPDDRVGTLHSHCYRALGRPELAEKHLDEWNEYAPDFALRDGSRGDLDDSTTSYGDDPYADERNSAGLGDELLGRYQFYRAELRPREIWPYEVAAFATQWEAWKREQDLLDFADLIDTAYETLPVPPGEPRYLYVDEGQDHDAAELRLLRQWGERVERLYLIADPDQCLYHWRGADPGVFKRTALPDEQRKVLSRSHRVPRAVHALAMDWISQIADREPVAYEPRDCEGAVRRMEDATWRYPEPLVPAIEEEIAAGKTVMVLASCGYMLRPVISLLRREGIPFHNPYRRRQGAWNPLTPGRGMSMADRLLALLRPQEAVWGAEARFWTPQDLKPWVEVVRAEAGLIPGAKAAIGRLGGTDSVTAEDMLGWFTRDALQALFVDDPLGWLEGAVMTAKARSLEFPLTVARARGAAVLREEPRVVVGTVHSVKGGEGDTVFVFPDLSFAGAADWAAGGERQDAIVRMFYVAATRSRSDLVICGAGSANAVPL